MEKSIENIWKDGFLDRDALIAPKLNNLYNQKSQHTIDKFMRMGKINLIAIIIGATVVFITAILMGAAIPGAIIFGLLIWLVIYGKIQSDKMAQIDKGKNSYEYIKAVDDWMKQMRKGFGRIYQVFYPVFFLALGFGIATSYIGQEAIAKTVAKHPLTEMIWGIPTPLFVGIIIVACLAAIFAQPLYRLDVNIVYGRVLDKFDEIIADIEELREA